MFEVIDRAQNYSHGSFETLNEAKGAVAFDRLDNWAIYNASGEIVEASEPLPEPTDIDVYQAIVNEIKINLPTANASVEYEGSVHVTPSIGFGNCYVLGDVNETWGADVYDDTDALENGDPNGSFDLEIPRENTDAVAIVKAFVAGVLIFNQAR